MACTGCLSFRIRKRYVYNYNFYHGRGLKLNHAKSGTFWSASRSGDDWKFHMSHHLSPGPYNPVEGKSALVCLTRSGVLRLLFQWRDGKWQETNIDIEGSASAVESSFTHASFAPDGESNCDQSRICRIDLEQTMRFCLLRTKSTEL